MATVAGGRLNMLKQLRCAIFQTAWNPASIRTGAKYLRKRLRGPSMIQYYPTQISFREVNKKFPELGIVDEDEVMRIKDLASMRARGKGAPKKAKTKADSRRLARKR
ncbi:hypothetical protein M422DRAFT_38857 [Sphaerobolus stellatus SS14]|uniref:Small ribosomal subunit protein mS33 n=1 Tax=Sphaerobolus stellatus (strain SS14) TaxID=990650 RepID=A0A0C9TTS1_SPHS4|nr:hypothetical protein M422DRAFT_38857 [Sphaerobolus stellatus SS14]